MQCDAVLANLIIKRTQIHKEHFASQKHFLSACFLHKNVLKYENEVFFNS